MYRVPLDGSRVEEFRVEGYNQGLGLQVEGLISLGFREISHGGSNSEKNDNGADTTV